MKCQSYNMCALHFIALHCVLTDFIVFMLKFIAPVRHFTKSNFDFSHLLNENSRIFERLELTLALTLFIDHQQVTYYLLLLC